MVANHLFLVSKFYKPVPTSRFHNHAGRQCSRIKNALANLWNAANRTFTKGEALCGLLSSLPTFLSSCIHSSLPSLPPAFLSSFRLSSFPSFLIPCFIPSFPSSSLLSFLAFHPYYRIRFSNTCKSQSLRASKPRSASAGFAKR